MRLAEATGVDLNKRILAFHEAPPQPSADGTMKKQRAAVAPLAQRKGLSSSGGSGKQRKIRGSAERVLDAPGMVDDYYLNLVDWSSENVVAIGLGEAAYIWRADKGSVHHITDAPSESYISSVKFSNDGAFLATAFGTGAIELWDVECNRRLRTMYGRQAQIASMSWSSHILSSGCADGAIWNHDVRVANHKVMEMIGHNGEVCGLEWKPDGEMLASGGNDNVVNIWDVRVGDVNSETRTSAKWTKRNHTAAVKVSLSVLFGDISLIYCRPSRGAHGARLSSQQAEEQATEPLISGTAPLAHVSHQSRLPAK
jgi:cell division cycle 20, cofactor of APC complex